MRKTLRVVSDRHPMGRSPRFLINFLSLVLVVSTLSIISPQVASAATVTATGTNPIPCNQTVDVDTGVTSERLDSGNCLVKFEY